MRQAEQARQIKSKGLRYCAEMYEGCVVFQCAPLKMNWPKTSYSPGKKSKSVIAFLSQHHLGQSNQLMLIIKVCTCMFYFTCSSKSNYINRICTQVRIENFKLHTLLAWLTDAPASMRTLHVEISPKPLA